MGYASLRSIFTDGLHYTYVGDDESNGGSSAEIKYIAPSRGWRLAALKLPCLIVFCSLLSAAITSLSLRRFPPACQPEQLLKTPVPDFPKEIRLFELNELYSDPPSPETDAAWNALLPFGRGYVFVDEPSQYSLEPGIETDWGQIYSVSMYHQMHCLGLVRRNYWRLLNAILQNSTDTYAEAEHQFVNSHTGHCFDYFRQSFECAADMTLEWPRLEEDGRRYQVDGGDIPHVCASKQALKHYMDVYHFNNSHNSDIAA
ncbi:hypothetical protein CDD82_3016 [Ophiocordyceps australis]|uniref:Uncharacterized protein n=1 Tax=Ophiocordyceps australis TaxID=1399860 RepID=A0A2C5ZBV5_9HYPO|nr:hypothetical protein CDD82_3016 [Ophiocordyceps australis]